MKNNNFNLLNWNRSNIENWKQPSTILFPIHYYIFLFLKVIKSNLCFPISSPAFQNTLFNARLIWKKLRQRTRINKTYLISHYQNFIRPEFRLLGALVLLCHEKALIVGHFMVLVFCLAAIRKCLMSSGINSSNYFHRERALWNEYFQPWKSVPK